MKWIILALAFLAGVSAAHAQQATVVSVCGTLLGPTYPLGSVQNMTQDQNGNHCTNANSAGSQAVTAAAGAFVSTSIPDIYNGTLAPWDSLSVPTGTFTVLNGLASIYEALLNPGKIVGNTGTVLDKAANATANAAGSLQVESPTSSHVQSTSLEASHIIKGSAGNLFGFYCSAITGGTTGYCIANNTTTAPSNSAATTPLDICYFTTAAGCSLSRIPRGVAYGTGITILISSNATPFTFTNTTLTGFISADFQ